MRNTVPAGSSGQFLATEAGVIASIANRAFRIETLRPGSSRSPAHRVCEEDLKQAAVVVASVAYLTAMRDEKLPRKPLPPPRKSETKS